jgi:phospholipase/carboxylesterase
VPVVALHAAKRELERLGIDVTSHVSSGLGHSVDPIGLKLGGEFVSNALRADAPAARRRA